MWQAFATISDMVHNNMLPILYTEYGVIWCHVCSLTGGCSNALCNI